MSKLRRLLSVAACTALLASLYAQNGDYQPDANWKAPAEAVARQNPLAHKPEAAAGGQKLFHRNCVECHGEGGIGLTRKHSANLLLPVVQEQTDGALFWKITNGNVDRGMPAFSKLPELQRWQLVLYVRSLKPSLTPSAESERK